ncbi:LLM class flavin-dependent oxidoreductase [Cellulomonas sp. Marseille-Q8402]
MTDYGHDLLFGSFITPGNADPERAVALAQVSERAGLDLATFQDHPYQPSFLDTWTLMSWVAARTERIRLAPNVANLPLRPPAVLARAVASLDLLSGGRVELGLGSGAFWDAIEAMGGRRLTPGQGVDALREAIDVIRALWDTGDRSRVDLRGDHYAVVGARRGPAPAHPVGIWVGAYKPRMLRLTGEQADGWLPSLSYLSSLADLDDGNARIDEAAEAAGRPPAAVRRLLNVSGQLTARATGNLLVGPPEQWVEQLAVLALEHGTSAFIVGGDDPALLAAVGQEIAPAVRELVAAERAARGTVPQPGTGEQA